MSQHLPAVPRAGAWRAPRTPSSRWGRKTRSAAAPEAAEVWSGPTEGNLGRSSGIARQPAARTEEDTWDAGGERRSGQRGFIQRIRGRREETEAISCHCVTVSSSAGRAETLR